MKEVEKDLADPEKSVAGSEDDPKKRYYSPQEVMKKKGCIGCGGMILAMPVILAALAWAVAGI